MTALVVMASLAGLVRLVVIVVVPVCVNCLISASGVLLLNGALLTLVGTTWTLQFVLCTSLTWCGDREVKTTVGRFS